MLYHNTRLFLCLTNDITNTITNGLGPGVLGFVGLLDKAKLPLVILRILGQRVFVLHVFVC